MTKETVADYSTTCPFCQAVGRLYVVYFRVSTRIPLQPDGFATTDCKFFDTTGEKVHCESCDKTFSLAKVML